MAQRSLKAANFHRSFFLGTLVSFSIISAKPAGSIPPVFPDSQYVRVNGDGHLQQGSKRVRFWGCLGMPIPSPVNSIKDSAEHAKAVAKARATIDLNVDRLADLGFNSFRSWQGHFSDGYTKGDGSVDDLTAYFFWKLDQKGIKIWESGINGSLGSISAADVDIINDPSTAPQWQEAMAELTKENKGPLGLGFHVIRFWDPRFEALVIKRWQKAAQWRNLYKGGLTFADDPQVIVWEITNEETWYWRLFSGTWLKLPSFYRNQLFAKWNGFLKAKYGTNDSLRAAWKFLLPGESLAAGSVMLAPLAGPVPATNAVNDANPRIIESIKAVKTDFTRNDFTSQRGEDVVEFFSALVIEHKQRLTKAIKTFGKSCKLSPTLWDAGNQFQTQTSYIFQFSDAVATCAYIQGMGHDPSAQRYPFFSGLDCPPRMCWDVPWLEQSSVKGKPHFVYEFNIGCRTKYRAEAATRIAALGSIEDWDIINWHTYGFRADPDKKDPFNGPIHVWHDYFEYGNDEVQLSAMKVAGEIFKNRLVNPAPNPTTFVIGKHTLFDPASMEYGRSYGDYKDLLVPTCYRYGSRIWCDPARTTDTIVGNSCKLGVYESNPVRPNNQLEYDWHLGHLIFDSPAAASYTGFFGQRNGKPIMFKNGTVIKDVTVLNPDSMPYPVTPEEGYVEISLVSTDGKSLAKTKKAIISAVSTSFNTGFYVDTTKASGGMHQNGPKNEKPGEYFGAWCETGREPVRVARVGATIECPAISGMKYTLRDWHMRVIGEGVIKEGRIAIPADKPVFITELNRQK